MGDAPTREELIAAATVLHDEECRSCDRKYRMSCPNMAGAILRAGAAARAATAAKAAAPAPRFAVGDRVRITGSHPWSGHAGEISGPFESASAPDLRWTVALDDGWSSAAVSESEIRRVP